MPEHLSEISSLFSRIPRRHNIENVKEINDILDEYETILLSIEGEPRYEKQVAVFFDDLDTIRQTVKNSSLNKYSKQAKDKIFDEGSEALKNSMESLVELLSS